MSQSKRPSDPLSLSHSERSQRSFNQALDEATAAIEKTRAQITRSRGLSQSEADLTRQIDSLNEEHSRLTRSQMDRA
jgi:hypothetical protein